MKGLTEKQRAVMATVRRLHAAYRRVPTQRELAQALGVGQPAVHLHLSALRRKGYVSGKGDRLVLEDGTDPRETYRALEAVAECVRDLLALYETPGVPTSPLWGALPEAYEALLATGWEPREEVPTEQPAWMKRRAG